MKKVKNNKNYCALYVVRHGQTEWNVQRRLQGLKDSPLTKEGINKVKDVGRALKKIKFDAVFSSDALRAKRTAEIIKLDRKLIIQTTKALREKAFGKYEGMNYVKFREIFKKQMKKRETLTDKQRYKFKLTPDFQSDEEFAPKFITFLRETAIAFAGKTVLIVSHGGTIRSFLVSMAFYTRKELPHGSVKNSSFVKLLSDGVDFFIKEVSGVEKS